MTELYLPSRRYSADSSAHAANDRALETWARSLRASIPIMLGRVINHIASSWGANSTHGWNGWAGATDNANGGLALTITKQRSETILRVIYGYSIHATVSSGAFEQAIFDVTAGTRHDIMHMAITQSAGFEHPCFTGEAFLTGKAAGSRTLTVQLQATTAGYEIHTDANDSGWMEIWEVPSGVVNTVMP